MIDWDKPATEAQIAQFIEDDRLPEPEELKALLERYLIGPITDEHATRLHADMDAILKDWPRLKGDRGTFRDRHHYAAGHAWCEEFSYGRGIPRTADLAIFHAATMRGYPAPKLYCPAFFVGTWKQGDPSPATAEPVLWRLAANGDFQSNHRSFAKNTQWCIQRDRTRRPRPRAFHRAGRVVRDLGAGQ